jgi:ankyrin repeat protein
VPDTLSTEWDSAIAIAIRAKDRRLLDLLLSYSQVTDFVDFKRHTALHYAALTRWPEIIPSLVSKKWDLLAMDEGMMVNVSLP